MANRTLLLCLLIVSLCVIAIECRRSGGGSRSSGRSHSSFGKSWGSSSHGSSWSSGSRHSSSSSHSYPSSSSGLSGFGSHHSSSSSSGFGSYKYPSSSSGLSGFGSSYPSSSSSFGRGSSSSSYPSSSSGLSGSGSSYPSSSSSFGRGSSSSSYPSSSSGLSGSGSSYPSSSSSFGRGSGPSSYPSSSTGLSGSGSRYPSTSNSGFGSKPSYPSSSTGLSGSDHSYSPPSWGGSQSIKPSYNYPSSSSDIWGTYNRKPSSGGHSYPSSGTGMSGSGTSRPHISNPAWSNANKKPTYETHYHPTYTQHTYNHGPSYVPTYYSSPQHVYVHEYRHSDSRYGDVLTGLALYNLGRSHSHYHEHYYYDDYYRRRYYSHNSGTTDIPQNRPGEEATCVLKITENGQMTSLKVPCEIVSTFSEGSRKTNIVNTTVCTTNTTVVKNIVPLNSSMVSSTTEPPRNSTGNQNSTVLAVDNARAINLTSNGTDLLLVNSSSIPISSTKSSADNVSSNYLSSTTEATSISTATDSVSNSTQTPIVISTSEKPNVNSTIKSLNSTVFSTVTPHLNVNTTQSVSHNTTTFNVTTVNVTTCTSTSKVVDPLEAKGSKLKTSDMRECVVEIHTKDHLITNNVDCEVLLSYAKMPEPKKESDKILPSREKLKKWLSNPPWWMSMFIAV